MTDIIDWPSGLPENERAALTERVREVLEDCKRPLGTFELAERVRALYPSDTRLRTFMRAAVWDWILQAVARAAREAGAVERWCLRGKGE